MFAQKKVTLPPGRHKTGLLDEADRYSLPYSKHVEGFQIVNFVVQLTRMWDEEYEVWAFVEMVVIISAA